MQSRPGWARAWSGYCPSRSLPVPQPTQHDHTHNGRLKYLRLYRPRSAAPSLDGFTARWAGYSCRPPGGIPLSPCLKTYGRHPHQQVRGAKTKVTIKLEDLPQGLIEETQPLPEEKEEPVYPTVVQQARRNMNRFQNCVLLTRVGGFYELYFEHAREFGPQLNLKVAMKKTAAGNVAMAGFPFFQLDRFLKILVQDLNRYVAIAEEFPNNAADRVKAGGLLHDRRVARVVTPGTLIDENFMDPYSNNYIMSIHLSEQPAQLSGGQGSQTPVALPEAADELARTPLGIAWLDLSTGHFITQSTTLGSLGSVLSRVGPKEVVVDHEMPKRGSEVLLATLAEERRLTTRAERPQSWTPADWAPMLESDMSKQAAEAFSADEVHAANLLLHYVKDRLQNVNVKLQPPRRHDTMEVMAIDRNSMRSLEIKKTIRDDALRGSLLYAIRGTVTRSGARLLSEWLSAPSTSLDTIEARQELVSRFFKDETLRDSVVMLLRRCADSQRLVQKFALGRGDPDDLLDLERTISATDEIVALLQGATAAKTPTASIATSSQDCLKLMVDRISLAQPVTIAGQIRAAIDEDGLVQQHKLEDDVAGEMVQLAQGVLVADGSADISDVLPKAATLAAKKRRAVAPVTSIREYYGADNDAWIMKPGASPVLSSLHAELAGLLCERAALLQALQARLQAQSLTLKWTPNLGHVCHVKGKDVRLPLDGTKPLSSSRSTRTFHVPEWTELGARMDKTRAAVRAEEQRVFHRLRQAVVRALVPLRRNASVLDELDVATSMARLARDNGWVRPLVNRSTAHAIVGGRHPTVEGGLSERGRSFTSNSCFVGSPGHGRVWLVTGPNMAGKSTFLRQNALITILAQIGCFVPADHAEIGIVDALFSRVGSADDLYRDQSTFMVEMLETAQILRDATPRSFVVMDEIGRGTTPEDGTAVAFACIDHLVKVNRCRTLFATHFHAVADLAVAKGLHNGSGGNGSVDMYCTDVEQDQDGSFAYVHRLRKGINRDSHALKVARLAGLPEAAIRTAMQVLQDEFRVGLN